MVKKKQKESDNGDDELSIPIPIQTFLWRQTSPFIRPKLTKLCEASCVSFERVIVQNILHGLSPSLCEAIQSISRWKFVRAALPHVIHCCAAILKNRAETNPESKFNSIETKLLYTLHWIILDAAAECEDTEPAKQECTSNSAYLHSLDTIQLFVFLLIPLISSLRHTDFENLKLENGLRLWEPLWHYQQPNVACFSTSVKSKHLALKTSNENSRVNFNMANIYLGQETSSEGIFSGSEDKNEATDSESRESLSKNAPLAQMSDICALSNRNSMEESATFTRTSLMLSSSDQDKVTSPNFNSDPIFVNKVNQINTGRPSSCAINIISATYFDVAILQSLFCPQWDEEGVNWALQYILKRLIDIKLESARLKKSRQFSHSMPNLEISKEREQVSLSFPRKDSASVEAFLASCSFPHAMCPSLPEKNKVMTNLRSFYLDSTRNASADFPRTPVENPTIICKTDNSNMGSSSPTACQGKKEVTELFDRHLQPIQKPIITITCDTSKPFPNFAWPVKKMTEIGSTMQKQASDDPVIHDISQHENIQRSNTDSKIHYTNNEDMNEASGSTFYVGSDGQLKYDVILLAIYNLSSRHYSSRVCNIVVDIIKCFIDLNFFKKPSRSEHAMRSKKKYDTGEKHVTGETHQSPFKKSLSRADADSMFCMALDILFRVFRAVGCVHGCSDCSFKIADNFRDRMFDCLERLMEVDTLQFRRYLVTQFIEQPLQLLIESLHVLLGYCSDTINIYHMGGAKKHSMCDFHGSLGYSNNFGEPPMNLNSIQNKIIVCIWKKLLVKFVEGKKEIFAHENIHLYHEVKQLVNYMKDNNGSTFRCIALSFLFDAFKSSGKFSQEQVSCVIGEEEKDNQLHNIADCPPYKSKSLFKKKTKKHSFPSPMDNTIEDPGLYHMHASPRTSIFSIADDDIQFLAKKKSVKIFKGFHKSPKSDPEDDFSKDYGNGANEALMFAKGQRMSFKATGQATMRLLSARRKLEDGFKSFGRKHGNKRESICDGNLFGDGSQHNVSYSAKNSTLVREKKLINLYVMKSGLVRFNFLLEFCNPGTLPDPPLVASLLDLEAPVLGRAALLLECAHFVNRCNHGDWPNWMKLNYGGLCSTGRGHMSHQSVSSRNLSMQKAAGELFYQWAETLGNRMSEILIDENPDFYSFINKTTDDGKKQDVRQGDHDEDYLDEETVNRGGRECPHPLKLVACHLLYEITAYLRETHQNLPRMKCQHYEKVPDNKNDPNRRWSSVFTSPENSEFSNANKGQGEAGSDRKISFAVLGVTTRSDSMHSSTNSISQANTNNSSAEMKSGKKPVTQAGQKLLRARRGSDQNSTFRHNRSFKITHHNEPGLSRVGSTKHRKVSTQSLHSANSTEETVSSSYAIFEEEENEEGVINGPSEAEQSPGVYYEEKGLDENMPWVKVVVQLANKSNFVCDHQNFCHTNCYERQRRSCTRLVLALKKVYSSIPVQSCSTENITSLKTQAEKIKHKETTKHRRTSSSSGPHHSPHSSKSNCSVGSNSSDRNDDVDLSNIMKYLDNQVANLTQSPLAVIAKAAPILSDDIFIDIMPIAWELLLESDQELAAVAASVFILSSIRVPEHMQEMITYQFHHQDVSFRIGAILRFSTIWNSRFQVWHRMEDGAQLHFKVPPPNIDFVLPSPTIGLANIPVIDSPWMPHFKTKVEEVTINQKESKSLVNATTTRRKQQQQMIHQALLAEEDKRRVARENCLMTSVPVCLLASIEPALLHSNEDHDDALQEELSLAVATRRMSVAVVNRASNVRNLSGRHGSVFFCRPPMQVEDDDKPYQLHCNQMHLAQAFFPSFICQSTINIIQCLNDFEVNVDGTSVSEVAEKIIWKCLVEDPALFLRTFLEKLTNKNRQKELIFLLRKLLWHIPILPSQAAHCLFNYLIGFVMFHVRSPSEGGLEAITEALSIVWQVVPCVTGIYFKDLKQTLRKEQCDSTLLVAANVPSAKKLIVHGPDLSCIPSQFLIQEDTQFIHILQESLEFFNIPADVHHEYFLVDTKTNHMHSMNSFVRDFYFFRRNFYPQLSLVRMDHDEAKAVLERETFRLKFLETEKVLFSLAVLNSSQGCQFQSHVTYLHEEFLKLPSFPRKALETELFSHLGATKHEILEMDMLHKFSWTMLISTMFRGMSSAITHVGDLPLFLNVINGVTILHADDVFLLRFLIATYINVCRHFKQVFSTTGFSFILRTILKVYSSSSSNVITTRAIQFVCRQFFLLHRNSFVLQLFGIVSSMLETSVTSKATDKKLDTKLFYDLLVSMNEDISDELNILELMDDERPIQSLDFCYKDDPNTFSIMDAMNLCVTVVAHSVESIRASQMLTIMEAILPHFLSNTLCQHPRSFHDTSVIDEILIINNLTVFIKILVSSCESMARFNRFQFEPNTKPLQGLSSQSPRPKKHKDDPTEFRFVNIEEGNSSQFQEFVKPRNSVLSIASDFYLPCLLRSRELHNLDPSLKIPDLLDHKSHVRLADIAHSLLKVSAHDPATINSVGLQKYMIKVMPNTDWSQASIRPALNLILRRIERFLNKIYKKMIPMANLNWDAITNLISAINSTLANCSFIGHLPQMKALVYACIHLVMGDEGLSNTGSSYSLPHRVESNSSFKSICPLQFCSVSIKLALRLISILGDSYSLEQLCEASASMYSSVEKLMGVIINIIFPSSLELSNHKIKLDCMVPRKSDVTFALTIILSALLPNFKHSSGRGDADGRSLMGISSSYNTGSHLPPENFTKVVFLGLKILMVCFEKQLSTEWHKIAKVITQMVYNRMGGTELWSFLDFVISCRGALFVLLLPLIQHKLTKGLSESSHKYQMVDAIKKRLNSYDTSDKRSSYNILLGFASEMLKLKDENLSGNSTKIEEENNFDFDKLKTFEKSVINQNESGSPIELNHKNSALNYKEVSVIKATDGNLILNKYFQNRQKSANRIEGCFEMDNTSLYEDPDIDMHRLQRQDAKSRKTFKIKRNCSTFNRAGILGGSITRSATVKGAAGHHRFNSNNKGSVDKTLDVSQKTPNNKFHPDKAESESSLLNCHLNTDTSKVGKTASPTSDTDSQKKQTVLRLHKQSVYRSRFMQKSKSHEDDAPAGTARGKIARHGLKATQQSPVKSSEKDVLLTKSESNESLKDEKSSLLDLKSHVDLDGSDDMKVDKP